VAYQLIAAPADGLVHLADVTAGCVEFLARYGRRVSGSLHAGFGPRYRYLVHEYAKQQPWQLGCTGSALLCVPRMLPPLEVSSQKMGHGAESA
jgi:hypothetical protein